MSCQCPMCQLHREIKALKERFGKEAFKSFDEIYEVFFMRIESASVKLFDTDRLLRYIAEDFTDKDRQAMVRFYLENSPPTSK